MPQWPLQREKMIKGDIRDDAAITPKLWSQSCSGSEAYRVAVSIGVNCAVQLDAAMKRGWLKVLDTAFYMVAKKCPGEIIAVISCQKQVSKMVHAVWLDRSSGSASC